MKEPPGFFFACLAHSIRAVQRVALRLPLRPKKKERIREREKERLFSQAKHERDPAGRREGEKIEMLISHRADGGNYVLMRSRLVKSPGKRDTRPDLRTRNGVPSLFLSPLSSCNPLPHTMSVCYALRVYIYTCSLLHTYERGVIRQSRS